MNRRQFVKGGLTLSGLLLSGRVTRAEENSAVTGYTSNPQLRTILPGWKGTPLDQAGRFMNQEHPWRPDYAKIAKYMVTPNPQRREKKADAWRITVLKDER